MKKRFRILLLFAFTMNCLSICSQENINTNYLKNLLTDSLYSGKVILKDYIRGQTYVSTSNYLKNQNYEISNIIFLKKSQGDFNKNGIPDVFATMQIKYRSRNELYVCLVEYDDADDIATIYSYFEMSTYSKVTLREVKNDTLKVRTQMWGTNKESYLDRMLSLVHDEQNIIRIVTPNKLDAMNDISIFKEDFKKVKRLSFISNEVIRKQAEDYKSDDVDIRAELSGFNDLNLGFTITKLNLEKDFDKMEFMKEMFEFLQSNTRFPSILTRIEKVILAKNEEGLPISNDFKYDIKNYINPNVYFTIGEIQANGSYMFDLIYIENEN